MAYGHKSGHTADVRSEFFVPLPADLDPLLGIYVGFIPVGLGLLRSAPAVAKSWSSAK